MSSILKDRLLSNYEKALDIGRNVLILVCKVVLKGVPVADKFIGLSNLEKKKLGFNATQVSHAESGRALDDMDISIVYLIISAFGGLGPSRLQDLLKQFKNLRNDFVHEKSLFDLDKKELKAKLAELDVLYTEILQELKNYCDPAEIVLIDHNIAEIKGQLISLKKTLDDHLQDKTEALRRQTDKTTTTLETVAKVSASLDQTNDKTTRVISTLEQATSTLEQATSNLEQATSTFQQAAIDSKGLSINVQNVKIIQNLNLPQSTAQLSESEKKARIIHHLSTAQKPVNSLEIAKALGLQSKKDVNSTLYKLMEETSIEKVNESPPMWQIKTKGILSTQREVKLYNASYVADEVTNNDIESKFASMSITPDCAKNI